MIQEECCSRPEALRCVYERGRRHYKSSVVLFTLIPRRGRPNTGIVPMPVLGNVPKCSQI